MKNINTKSRVLDCKRFLQSPKHFAKSIWNEINKNAEDQQSVGLNR